MKFFKRKKQPETQPILAELIESFNSMTFDTQRARWELVTEAQKLEQRRQGGKEYVA